MTEQKKPDFEKFCALMAEAGTPYEYQREVIRLLSKPYRRSFVDFSTPSNSIKAEDLAVVDLPISPKRPDHFICDDPEQELTATQAQDQKRKDRKTREYLFNYGEGSSGEPGMLFVEDEVEAVKHLTAEEMAPMTVKGTATGRFTRPAIKPTNLYHWSSKSLAAHGDGDIIVMAETVEQARDKVYGTFDPLTDGNPFEDSYLQVLKLNNDENLLEEYMKTLNELREDLNQEPTVVDNDVVLLRGSD